MWLVDLLKRGRMSGSVDVSIENVDDGMISDCLYRL